MVFGHLGLFLETPAPMWYKFSSALAYSFHMPLFIILAGLTFNMNISPLQYIKKRFNQLLKPWIIAVIIYSLSFMEWAIRRPSANLLYELITDGNFVGSWFIPFLFWTQLFVLVISIIFKNNHIKTLLCLLLFTVMGILLSQYTVNTWLYTYQRFDVAIISGVFVYIGYLFKQKKYTFDNKIIFSISFLILALAALPNTPVDINFDRYGKSLPLFLINALCGFYVTMFISKTIRSSVISNLLAYIGENSLWVLFTHGTIIYAILYFCKDYTWNLAPLLIIGGILLAPCFIWVKDNIYRYFALHKSASAIRVCGRNKI